MMTFGSWRISERSTAVKRVAAARIDGNLRDAGDRPLDRILDADDVGAAGAEMASAAYNAVVLPDPVGPVTRTRPSGRARLCRSRASVSSS